MGDICIEFDPIQLDFETIQVDLDPVNIDFDFGPELGSLDCIAWPDDLAEWRL